MRTLRLGLTYAIGDVALKGLSLVLALAYANSLTTSDFGILAIVTAISAPVSILLGFGLKAAVFHFHFAIEDPLQEERFYGTAWLFSIGVPFVALLIVDTFLRSTPISLPGTGDISLYLRFALWSDYLNNSFKLVVQEILRAKEKAVAYASLAFGNAATLLGLVIVIVLVGRQGVMGVLTAMLLAGAIWALLYSLFTARYMRLRPNLRLLKRGLTYSLPLLPHFLSHWLLNLSDRLILGWFAPAGEVGTYALGYKVGNAYEVLVTAGNNSIMPRFAKAFTDRDLRGPLVKLFTQYVLLMGILALGIGAISDEAIRLLVPGTYQAAIGIAKWIVMAFFALALYYGPMNAVTLTAGKTVGVARLTIVAGSINVISNLIFVPQYGAMAAAVNTVVGYTVLFALILARSRSVTELQFELKKLALVALFLGLGLWADSLFASPSIALGLLVDALLLAGYVAVMWLLNVLDLSILKNFRMLLQTRFWDAG